MMDVALESGLYSSVFCDLKETVIGVGILEFSEIDIGLDDFLGIESGSTQYWYKRRR